MDDNFCSENPSNHTPDPTHRLKPLKRDTYEYFSVEKLFKAGWKHPKKRKPKLRAIFKILWPMDLLEPYLAYRDNTDSSVASKKSLLPGNECLLFHGTNRACMLGEDSDRTTLCTLPQCFLCSIIRTSFDITQCGSKNNFKRFGTAIYTTACSSKADDYCHNLLNDATCRVLLVNRVVVGKAYKTKENDANLVEPPLGFHSVVGVPGVHLNYEETVIYNDDAIRPAYLVAYDIKPGRKENLRWNGFLQRLFQLPLAV